MPCSGAYLIASSATGSPPTERGFSTLISAPINLRILITPIRVGLMPTCSSTTSDPGQIAAATRKKVAEEMSLGTSMVVALNACPPSRLTVEPSAERVSGWQNPQHPFRMIAAYTRFRNFGYTVGIEPRQQETRFHLRTRHRHGIADTV